MKNALIVTSKKEEKVKERLRKAIEKKKERLGIVTAKYEMLKVELELIKHEYDVRIGSLYVKDNQLDIEIIRYKDILHLMSEEKMSYDEAVLANEAKFYNTNEEFVFDEDMTLYDPKSKEPDGEDNDRENYFRALWKKLILKFHPDLVIDKTEKTKREEILKKINNAYREKNYEALESFDVESAIDDIKETSTTNLEAALVYIENKIISIENQYKKLKETEWYGWKKNMMKAKKEKIDVFKDIERMLLDDIVKKLGILRELKNKVGEKK